MRSVRKNIRKEGYIYIITPNYGSASSKVFGQDFEHLIPPEHINYFSKKSLSFLLNRSGFKIISMNTWGYPENLAGIIKKYIKRSNSITNNAVLSSKQDIKSSKSNNIKYFMFDQIFCGTLYKILDHLGIGINIQVIAQKI